MGSQEDRLDVMLRHTLFDRRFPPGSVPYDLYRSLQADVDALSDRLREGARCVAPVAPACPPNLFHVHLYEKLRELAELGAEIILLFLDAEARAEARPRATHDADEHASRTAHVLPATSRLASEFAEPYASSPYAAAVNRLIRQGPHMRPPPSISQMARTLHAADELGSDLFLVGEIEWHSVRPIRSIVQAESGHGPDAAGLYLPILDWATPGLTVDSDQRDCRRYFRDVLERCRRHGLRRTQDATITDIYRYFFHRDLDAADLSERIREEIPVELSAGEVAQYLACKWQEHVTGRWGSPISARAPGSAWPGG